VHSPGKLRRRRHFADVGGVAFIAIGSVARVAWCGCCVFFFFFSISLSATSFFYDQGSRTRKIIWAMSPFSNSLRINLQTNREWKRMSCWNQRDSLIYKHVHITSGVEEKKKFYIGFVGVFFTSKIQDDQDYVFQFWSDIVNYKTHGDLSWFRPLLRGNSYTSNDLILKINSCYKGWAESSKNSRGEEKNGYCTPAGFYRPCSCQITTD
jgi:hypothetical protein